MRSIPLGTAYPVWTDTAGCHLGEHFTLKGDRTVFVDGDVDGVRWSSTAATLSLCQAGVSECIECVALGGH